MQITSTETAPLLQMADAVLVIEELGNPFLDMTADRFTLDTKVVMPNGVIQSVKFAEGIGKEQYQTVVEARINDNITKFKDTLPKNCLQLFNSSFEKVKSKYLSKVSDLKTECPVVLKDVHCLPI